ncbi:MAG TPA: MBL fold metallo-hydrolase [Clostridiales bacterium]|jgi:ribonuclease/clavin/mitogillin|nr:MBL fold metallo-hydrolase [Clostridiales bacterium]
MNEVKTLKYGNTRCYCINNRVMIDTDWAGTLPAFFKCIKENHIKISDIEYLIVTHFHPDHMGISQEFIELGMTLIAFEEQRAYIHCSDSIFSKDKNTPFKPIDGSKILFMSCADSRSFLFRLGIEGEVIHTAGHSDDSISVILDEGIAIVGDLSPLHTISGYKDKRLEESWNSILSHNIKKIYYGHFNEEYL